MQELATESWRELRPVGCGMEQFLGRRRRQQLGPPALKAEGPSAGKYTDRTINRLADQSRDQALLPGEQARTLGSCQSCAPGETREKHGNDDGNSSTPPYFLLLFRV